MTVQRVPKILVRKRAQLFFINFRKNWVIYKMLVNYHRGGPPKLDSYE